jgi:hypothetical protein
VETICDERKRAYGVTYANVVSGLHVGEEIKRCIPTMSSTKKKMVSIMRRRVIFAERDIAILETQSRIEDKCEKSCG